jgi:DNA-binding CsgD family transcriptional regulator
MPMPISAPAKARDLHAVLRVVQARQDQPGQRGLPWPVLINLAEIISCDQLSFFELDATNQTVAFSQDMPAGDDADDEAFWANYWQCQACCYPDVTAPNVGENLRSVTIFSDFYPGRAKRRIGMYADYFRPAGIEHEMMACLPLTPRRTLRLVFFRGPGSDFTEADRAILTLLRPHLRELYREPTEPAGPSLTGRQQELLRLVADGHTNLQIARRLAISEGTVRKHMENIFDRLGVTSRTAAVAHVFAQPR